MSTKAIASPTDELGVGSCICGYELPGVMVRFSPYLDSFQHLELLTICPKCQRQHTRYLCGQMCKHPHAAVPQGGDNQYLREYAGGASTRANVALKPNLDGQSARIGSLARGKVQPIPKPGKR